MRTLIWFAYFWISLVGLIPAMRRVKKLDALGKIDERDALIGRKVQGWMSVMLRLAGVRVDISGKENIPDAPVIFVSNHQGNFDIPILLANLDYPYGLVAKIELQKMPLIRTWMHFMGCVFIDRNNPRRSAAALNQAVENIKSGKSMIVFPEGTRSRSDTIGEFKAGSFKIAQKTGAIIVPICIDGSYRVMEANGMRIKPAEVRVQILPPIETSNLSREEFREIGARVRAEIAGEKMSV